MTRIQQAAALRRLAEAIEAGELETDAATLEELRRMIGGGVWLADLAQFLARYNGDTREPLHGSETSPADMIADGGRLEWSWRDCEQLAGKIQEKLAAAEYAEGGPMAHAVDKLLAIAAGLQPTIAELSACADRISSALDWRGEDETAADTIDALRYQSEQIAKASQPGCKVSPETLATADHVAAMQQQLDELRDQLDRRAEELTEGLEAIGRKLGGGAGRWANAHRDWREEAEGSTAAPGFGELETLDE